MKIDRSLEEVWEWKDEVYRETKGMNARQTVQHINKGADEFCRKYGIKLKTFEKQKSS